MCQVDPIPYLGVGFEDGSSYYLGWTGSTPGHGQQVAYITDTRNTLEHTRLAVLTTPANTHDVLHRDRRRRFEDLQVLPQQFRFAGTALA